MIAEIRRHSEFHKAGMLLAHNGVVRANVPRRPPGQGPARVGVDHPCLARILSEQRNRPGIIDIRVAIAETATLAVGDDVMILIVARRYPRECDRRPDRHSDLIKTTVTKKTE